MHVESVKAAIKEAHRFIEKANDFIAVSDDPNTNAYRREKCGLKRACTDLRFSITDMKES